MYVNITIPELPDKFNDLSDRRKRQIVEYLNEMQRQIWLDAVDQCISLMLAIPVVVLRDKFGFGKVRHGRFINACQTWIKAVNNDPKTMQELCEIAQKEAGYELFIKE